MNFFTGLLYDLETISQLRAGQRISLGHDRLVIEEPSWYTAYLRRCRNESRETSYRDLKRVVDAATEILELRLNLLRCKDANEDQQDDAMLLMRLGYSMRDAAMGLYVLISTTYANDRDIQLRLSKLELQLKDGSTSVNDHFRGSHQTLQYLIQYSVK